jgi:predicted acetyltransferase
MERKDEIIDYINEFVKYNSNINGTGALDKILEGLTFEEALDRCLKMEDSTYASSFGKSPSKTFLLIRKDDNKIIGTLNLRWDLTENLKRFGGNIGYGIRPLERLKGYNKLNLYLGLMEAQKKNLDTVMLDCDIDNLGSEKTILALGGILNKEEINPYNNKLTKSYNIDVEKSLNDYKDYYEKYL